MAYVVALALLSLLFSLSVHASPEQGKWDFKLDENRQFAAVSKLMYKQSKVTVSVSLDCEGDVEISWLLRMSPCAMEFLDLTQDINSNQKKEAVNLYMTNVINFFQVPYDKVEVKSSNSSHSCLQQEFKLEGIPNQKPISMALPKISKNTTETPAVGKNKTETSSKQKRAAPLQNAPEASKTKTTARPTPNPAGNPDPAKTTAAPQPVTTASKSPRPDKLDHPVVASTWIDGNYIFILKIKPKKPEAKFSADVTIRMFFGDESYISAMDYPLLIFYGVMGLVYIVYGFIWLVLLACNWRDLLRVQFWIGGVILLGMLEKAVFFAEYENVNKTGVSVRGAVIFAELVSCMKRTLARMLVIIVSLGFGVVKPRLGQAFHKVLFVGILFFVLAAIEGCMRATTSKADQSNQFLFAAVPLAVLDAVICWWILSSLIQTTRTLRLRRNVVKLTLYRHFMNLLIFGVVASIAYMIWFMTQHKFKECIKDWKQLWVDEAFWHVLFVVLLFVIMLLWRPTANNQRYAFSPLLDAAEEEDDEDAIMNDAFDGMKLRGVKASNGSPKQRDAKSKVEDDLKWVEDNIPSSMADKALPTFLDSDEELMTTKFEMSKME